MILIRDDLPQYKANLHCHSTYSDGKLTPEELKEAYRSHGYDILAITDHDHPRSHTALSEDDFILLTGYEAQIKSGDQYAPEIHMNLLARDPENVSFVGFDPVYTKFLREDNAPHLLRCVGKEGPREYSVAYVNQFIRTAKENGYIVTYNHPVWSMEDYETVLAYEGFFSMEIFNSSGNILNGMEYSAALYDKLICSGKRLAVHAADDNHNFRPFGYPGCDSFGGFTMISAPSLTYSDVFSALEKGDFYASRGPRITRLSVDGRNVSIDCSPAAHVHVYTGCRSPKHCYPDEVGESITHAEFTVDEKAKYFRVSVVDGEGKTADTRAYFADELGW